MEHNTLDPGPVAIEQVIDYSSPHVGIGQRSDVGSL